MIEWLGFIFVAIGLAFDIFGCIGLVRLPDLYLRLQAGTKCVTLGTCSILFGTFLITGPLGGGVKALLCMLFIVLTNPVAAHAIARSAHRAGIKLWEGTVVDHYSEDKK
ncbi:MAG: monovalent cation/H(+) antiporter subunit G [Elusimicrobiota bacterium]|jgi:multicomponent Na+:H+ antiporter subunit G